MDDDERDPPDLLRQIELLDLCGFELGRRVRAFDLLYIYWRYVIYSCIPQIIFGDSQIVDNLHARRLKSKLRRNSRKVLVTKVFEPFEIRKRWARDGGHRVFPEEPIRTKWKEKW